MQKKTAFQQKDELEVSFFVPCLNEERNVIATVETILEAVRKAGCSFEIIIADDHSVDHSVSIVEKYMAQHPELPIRLIRNEKQKGLGRNYADIAFVARGSYYKLVGASNRELAGDIAAMLEKRGSVDMVLHYLEKDERELNRRILSFLFTKIVNFITGYSLKYYNGSALHRRYNVMRWHSYSYGYSYQVELIIRLLEEGATYCEVPTTCPKKENLKTKAFSVYNICSVLHSLLQIFLQTLRRKLFVK